MLYYWNQCNFSQQIEGYIRFIEWNDRAKECSDECQPRGGLANNVYYISNIFDI